MQALPTAVAAASAVCDTAAVLLALTTQFATETARLRARAAAVHAAARAAHAREAEREVSSLQGGEEGPTDASSLVAVGELLAPIATELQAFVGRMRPALQAMAAASTAIGSCDEEAGACGGVQLGEGRVWRCGGVAVWRCGGVAV